VKLIDSNRLDFLQTYINQFLKPIRHEELVSINITNKQNDKETSDDKTQFIAIIVLKNEPSQPVT
jgi:hypothetical protein